jgi:hypothetical protein
MRISRNNLEDGQREKKKKKKKTSSSSVVVDIECLIVINLNSAWYIGRECIVVVDVVELERVSQFNRGK